MKTKDKVPFYQSKTKMAALLIGIGPVLITVGGMIDGSIDFVTGITQLSVSIGVICGVLGIRDLPFINKK